MAEPRQPRRGASVVVLEDDAELGELLCETFCELGAASCRTAASLAEAVTLPGILQADLVVLDVHLGDNRPTGVDAWRWLRACAFGGRVVFLTGHAATNPLVTSAAAIAEAPVLSKPVSMEELARLL